MGKQHFVYVVDDDPDLLDSIAFELTSLDMKCRRFSSAEGFLSVAAELEPGCILTDLNMPRMSGLELQSELLKRCLDWPLIFMTGAGEIGTAVHAIKRGAIEFIEKPFSENALLSALHQGFVELRKAEAQGGSGHDQIRSALQAETIFPHYQPKVDLKSGDIVGFEALLRWNEDEGDTGRASAIHSAFQDDKLQGPLTNRMFEQVLNDLASWQKEGIDFGHVSINASSHVFDDLEFADNLLAMMSERQVPPGKVQIEVTESVSIDPNADQVRTALDKLAGAGVEIALDDFGTGFASLTHLQSLPIDVIKIDRRFVKDFRDPASASIVKAIVGLSKGLGKRVVAEGVETPAQARFLQESGCDLGQGFLFGRAIPAAEVPDLLKNGWRTQEEGRGRPVETGRSAQ